MINPALITNAAQLLGAARHISERNSERYEEHAEGFMSYNNPDAGRAYNEIAAHEKARIAELSALGQEGECPSKFDWDADWETPHYLSWAYHVHVSCIADAERVHSFYAELAKSSVDFASLAGKLAEREAANIAALKAKLAACKLPPADWDDDPDPPNWDM
jgi:hypothetical protein